MCCAGTKLEAFSLTPAEGIKNVYLRASLVGVGSAIHLPRLGQNAIDHIG